MRVVIDHRQAFSEFRSAVVEELARLSQHRGYLLDLPARRPDLTSVARAWHEEPATVVLERGAPAASRTGPTDADLTIGVAHDGRTSYWRYRTDVFDDETIVRMQHQLGAAPDRDPVWIDQWVS